MKHALFLAAAAATLAGCDDRPQGRAERRPGDGRYLGVGIYGTDRVWQELAGGDRPKDPKAATIADDSEIIVAVDSATGEIRQCGNMSGRCVAMNPWRRPAGAAPPSLERHAADLMDNQVASVPSEKAAAKPRP